MISKNQRLTLLAGGASLLLTACGEKPLDFDLRGLTGGFSTADAAQVATAERPSPDDRGVISYPNYQVAVARRGDTVTSVAARVGVDAGELARFNGLSPEVQLRQDEIIALPARVAEPSAATGGPVDITSLAGNAINNAPQTTSASAPAAPRAQSGTEPARHRVERGETAYTVARLYGVPVKSLAEWNGLGADFAVREGQFLLIPVPQQAAPRQSAALPAAAATAATTTVAAVPAPQVTTLPGQGSPTPTPPSAATALPKNEPAKPAAPVAQKEPEKPVADVGKPTVAASSGRMVTPVQGTIIRSYAKGKNEGINISANAGSPVKAADGGTVAAITKSADGIPIIVVRHPDNLLTVYANVTDVSVAKGDTVGRGQSIAKLRGGSDNYVHFEVRKGFDSVDPQPYLN
ncbi:MAG: peptidoglycan DD-metalloendopeptidase family protein [Sulfitobacter sp.]